MEQWTVEDAKSLVQDYGFPLMVIGTPHSNCLDKFSGLRRRWANSFKPSKECEEYFRIEGETGEREYCEFGAGMPLGVKLLQDRFARTVQLEIYQSLVQQSSTAFTMMGIMNNTGSTNTLCQYGNTFDGVHYESLVPYQVEGMFRFLFAN